MKEYLFSSCEDLWEVIVSTRLEMIEPSGNNIAACFGRCLKVGGAPPIKTGRGMNLSLLDGLENVISTERRETEGFNVMIHVRPNYPKHFNRFIVKDISTKD